MQIFGVKIGDIFVRKNKKKSGVVFRFFFFRNYWLL